MVASFLRQMTARRVAAAALALVLAGTGFAAGWVARQPRSPSAIAYGRVRTSVIQAHLREVSTPYLCLAGDSYLELVPAERPPCGLDVVNGGVSGIRTGEYLRLARELVFERPPQVVLVALGTNDLLAKSEPASPAALARFRQDADALVDMFARTGAKVVVAAVPPIPEQLRQVFAPPAFKLYSDALAEICARRGCRSVDPYAAARSDEFWQGRPGTSPDGLHLGRLRGHYASIAADLCR